MKGKITLLMVMLDKNGKPAKSSVSEGMSRMQQLSGEFWWIKITNRFNIKRLAMLFVNPWGVEPQSKEPESFILSIELRVRFLALRAVGGIFAPKCGAKLVLFL